MQNCVFFVYFRYFRLQNVEKKLKKRAIFNLLFTFFSYIKGKDTKIPSAHISLTYIHTRILLPLLTFCALPILQKLRIYHVWFLFGVTPGVNSFSRHLRANQ